MEMVCRCKRELDKFITKENKSVEEAPKVIELSELVNQAQEPMLRKPKLANEICSHVELSVVFPVPAQVSQDSTECLNTPISETTAIGAAQASVETTAEIVD
jgi:microcompartment protein CcmL/EutN